MNDYKKWFTDSWNESCGLVSPKKISTLLGLSGGSASVLPIWEKKKFKIYRYSPKSRPLLAWKDYLTEEQDRRDKINGKASKTALSVEAEAIAEDKK